MRLSAPELSLDSLKSRLDNIPLRHLKHTKEILLRAPFPHRLADRYLNRDSHSCSDLAVQLSSYANENDGEEVGGNVHSQDVWPT